MSVLEYRGYQGSVAFEDDALLIQILHIDDLITTEVESAADAKKAFEELVDDYLTTCAAVGKEPNKPFKGSFNVRMPPALHRDAVLQAAREETSLNNWVVAAVREKLEVRGHRPAPTYHISPEMLLEVIAHTSADAAYFMPAKSHHETPSLRVVDPKRWIGAFEAAGALN